MSKDKTSSDKSNDIKHIGITSVTDEEASDYITNLLKSSIDVGLHSASQSNVQFGAEMDVNLDQLQTSHRLLEFQTKHTSLFHHKSLELSYKQLMAQRELIAQLVDFKKINAGQLTAVVKNTALPDYIKLRNTERVLQATRDNVIKGFIDKEQTGGVLNSVAVNIRTKLDRLFRGVGAANSVIGQAATVTGNADIGQLGQILGDSGYDSVTDTVAGKIKKILSTNRFTSRAYNAIDSGYSAIGENLQASSKRGEYDLKKEDGLFTSGKKYLLNGLAGLIADDSDDNPSIDVGIDLNPNPTDVAVFDNLTRRSIISVPKLLSEIHAEIFKFRTGNDIGDGKLLLDYDKSTISTAGKIKQTANSIINSVHVDQRNNKLHALTRKLGKSLDKSDARYLNDAINKRSIKGYGFTKEALLGDEFYANMPEDRREHIKTTVSKNLNNKIAHIDTVEAFSTLKTDKASLARTVKGLHLRGYGDLLEEDGLTSHNADGSVSVLRDSLHDRFNKATKDGFKDYVPTSVLSGLNKTSNKDIYRKGSNTPLIRVSLLNDGEYYHRSSGNMLSDVGDIAGEIIDADGNLIVSASDIEAGLVYVDGTPIQLNKMAKLTSNIGGVLKKYSGTVSKKTSELKESATDAMRDYGDKSNELLSSMLDILDERLPEPVSKMRKGGWRSILEKNDDEKQNALKETKSKPGINLGSVGSKLTSAGMGVLRKLGLGGAPGIGDSISGDKSDGNSSIIGTATTAAGTLAAAAVGKKYLGKKTPKVKTDVPKKIPKVETDAPKKAPKIKTPKWNGGVPDKLGKKQTAKLLAKLTAKSAGKALTKKIPLVAAAAGTAYAVDRYMDGDLLGATGEFASGIAGATGIGAPISMAIDSWLHSRDIVKITGDERDIVASDKLDKMNGDLGKILIISKGVTFKNMNPAFMDNFINMAKEYLSLTGNKIQVNSAFRGSKVQRTLHTSNPKNIPAAGKSLHNHGLAIDIQTNDGRKLSTLGLLAKYGFTFPIGTETWHMESVGMQLDIRRCKVDKKWASEVVLASKGYGVYGWAGESSIVNRSPQYYLNHLKSVKADKLLKLLDSPVGKKKGFKDASAVKRAELNKLKDNLSKDVNRRPNNLTSKDIDNSIFGGDGKDSNLSETHQQTIESIKGFDEMVKNTTDTNSILLDSYEVHISILENIIKLNENLNNNNKNSTTTPQLRKKVKTVHHKPRVNVNN